VQKTEAAKERVSSLLEKLKNKNKAEWIYGLGETNSPAKAWGGQAERIPAPDAVVDPCRLGLHYIINSRILKFCFNDGDGFYNLGKEIDEIA